jgi:hypothetical protein
VAVKVCSVVKRKKEQRIATIEFRNLYYRDCLNIGGLYECDENGVHYTDGWKVGKEKLYKRIAYIRVFVEDADIDYTDVDDLLNEYDLFCKSGEASQKLDDFLELDSKAYWEAHSQCLYFDYDISYIINRILDGSCKIEDGKVVDGEAMLDFSEENEDSKIIAACKYYEENSEIFNLNRRAQRGLE